MIKYTYYYVMKTKEGYYSTSDHYTNAPIYNNDINHAYLFGEAQAYRYALRFAGEVLPVKTPHGVELI